MGLTTKQGLFVKEYIIDFNATRAYQKVYGGGYNNARTNGNKLLTNPDIKEAVDKAISKASKRAAVKQEDIVAELAKIGLADINDFVTVENGVTRVKDSKDWPKDKSGAVVSIKEGRNGIEIKLADKNKGLELLGKHLGMYLERTEHSGTVGVKTVEEYLKDVTGDKF